MKKLWLVLILTIMSLMFCNSGLKSSGLVGYWTFDDSNANDFTGNHNGTVVGDGVTFPAGKVGNAVNFSIGSSFIKIPSFNTENITVEAWVNSTGYGYYTSMVTKNYYETGWSSPWTTWSLWFNENTANPGTISSQWSTASPEAVSMNEWHHMAFTYDGSVVKIYVNGAEKNSYEPTGGSITQTDGNIYIGKPEFANHSFTGSIDEVAIWDNALSGSDILRHYQNGLSGLGYILSPVVSTDSLTSITTVSAVCGGNIT
ncbi:MAG: LamG domain-containing protein, partial [Candidatus Delongbacteria bacterium]|nr:LamG domain-containing protein [Candidatus Delongbacteria bacterium]